MSFLRINIKKLGEETYLILRVYPQLCSEYIQIITQENSTSQSNLSKTKQKLK